MLDSFRAIASEMEEVNDAWMAGRENSEIALMKLVQLQEAKGSIHFQMTLTPANVPNEDICKCAKCNNRCSLELPRWFVEDHEDKFEESVLLRCGTSSQPRLPWTVQLQIKRRSYESPHAKFTNGWRAFAAFNGFEEGDTLFVCLRAMSSFEVYRFCKNWNLMPSSFCTPTRAPISVDGLCGMIRNNMMLGQEGSAASVSDRLMSQRDKVRKCWLEYNRAKTWLAVLTEHDRMLAGLPPPGTPPLDTPLPGAPWFIASQYSFIRKHGSQSVAGNSNSAQVDISGPQALLPRTSETDLKL